MSKQVFSLSYVLTMDVSMDVLITLTFVCGIFSLKIFVTLVSPVEFYFFLVKVTKSYFCLLNSKFHENQQNITENLLHLEKNKKAQEQYFTKILLTCITLLKVTFKKKEKIHLKCPFLVN